VGFAAVNRSPALDQSLVDTLLSIPEPSIHYLIKTNLHKEDIGSSNLFALHQSIRTSERVRTLLSERDGDGRIHHHPYQKWTGAHWTLAALADLNYPTGDGDLLPLADQVAGWILGDERRLGVEHRTKVAGGFPIRSCGSMEGNALLTLIKLGLREDVWPILAQTLLDRQWPDGGWNCDVTPSAHHSSFMETLLPMRALWLYGSISGDRKATLAAERAKEIFLKRQLFLRQSDGSVIAESFTQLHYPVYWHYDILAGLGAMREMDSLEDPRCMKAIELLKTKQLPNGGFPAEAKYYHSRPGSSNTCLVEWGPVSKQKLNPWVTVRAGAILADLL
jgi:hypothetical protein